MSLATRLVVPRIAAVLAPLFVTSTASPLEKTSVRVDTIEPETWTSAGTCTVRYYNICTGWIWVWSGWSTGEQVGTVFHECCRSGVLQLTSHLTFSGIGSGWGYTGTIEVYAADANDCPTGPALQSQPWLPPRRSGWTATTWNVQIPSDFVVLITWQGNPGFDNPTQLASDHPVAGPTGPQACGTCFPTTRLTRSYHYGNRSAPLCPGTPLSDGTCDVEFLVDAHLDCPFEVEGKSWGRIKGLYR